MRQTDGDDWCGWRLAQDWREMEEGGHTSHSHYIGDNSTQCQGGYFGSLDWSDYNFQQLSFPTLNVQTDTIKRKERYIHCRSSVSIQIVSNICWRCHIIIYSADAVFVLADDPRIVVVVVILSLHQLGSRVHQVILYSLLEKLVLSAADPEDVQWLAGLE